MRTALTDRGACIAGLLIAGTGGTSAQVPPGTTDYPVRPVRLVAASAPGGGIDLIGRILAQRLTETWAQQVVVDNRAGSGGLIATTIVAQAPADGYTLLNQSVGVSYVGTLHRNAPFDVLRDLVPVVLTASQPSLIAVHPSVAVGSMRDLIELARAKPGFVTYGSGGAGGASHMGTELLASYARVKLTHVPYKGTGPSTAALLAGEVNLAMIGILTAAPHARTGKIRALAVTGGSRSPAIADVPTAAEAGVPGYEFAGWYGVFAPARLPSAVVRKINADVNRALRHAETSQRFAAAGIEPIGGAADAFAKYFQSEVAKWQKVIREAGIRAD